MNLKPVIGISPDGKGIIVKKALSLAGNVRQIMNLVKLAPVEQYAIIHSESEKRASKLALMIEEVTGKKPLYMMSISPIVAMNAGIGAVAVTLTYESEVTIQ
jgi:uncharacterized protein